MQPVFPRINTAIFQTLEYYKTGRIRDTIARLSKVERITSIPHILDSWLEILYDSHKDMEAEIQQTIFTSTQNMQVELFDYLKDWVLDWRMQGINIAYIQEEIEKVNNRDYDSFVVKVEGEIVKFQQTPNFTNLKHLEVIKTLETSDKAFNLFILNLVDSPFPKNINYKFYCINEKPEFIDPSYIVEYARITNPIFDNFRSILIKYLTRYNDGKIVSNAQTQIVIERQALPSSNETLELPAPDSTTNPKLKTNLSVPQLALLFKMLNDLKPNIFNVNSEAELIRFISANFDTKQSKESGISTDKLRILFNQPDSKAAEFWEKHYYTFIAEVKKHK